MSQTLMTTSPTRAALKMDDHVGARIRLRRTLLGLTQEQLAASLNISYQQIQKYETGANRISAGRLFEIALRLSVDVSYFFDGMEANSQRQQLPHGGHNRVAIELVRNFLEIDDDELRTALANLVKTMRGPGHPGPIA